MRVAVLVLVAACGRFGFDHNPETTEREWQLRVGPGPGELIGPRLAYHAGRGSVILYGGDRDHPPPRAPSAEMWELTRAGWQLLCSPCAPGPRYGQGLAYDTGRDRLVMYGGATDAAILDETWEWDGTTWASIATTSTAGPRVNTELVYDAGRARLVLFGGSDGASSDHPVFEYVGGGWVAQPAGAGPGPLDGQGMHAVYDPDGARILVIPSERTANHDELWAWTGAWTQICTACTGQPRSNASIVYDTTLGRALLMGGWNLSMEFDGTWQLVGAAWQSISPQPPRRDSTGTAYDDSRHAVILFGGNGAGCLTGEPNCDETWELVPK